MSEQRTFVQNRVSIVTPVFNGEGHLAYMLDSVLAQTYDEVEMILVDDGSTDGTLAVAEAYREKFAARGYGYRIVEAEHKNASAAINRGLPHVTGEYLIWPDSDDSLKPESVERRVSFFQEHQKYHCVRTLFYYFDGETKEIVKTMEEQMGDLSKEELFWDLLEIKTYVCCGCYMVKSAAFFEIYPDRHIPEYDVGQNFQMLLPFMYRHPCPTIQEPLYGVGIREYSHSRAQLSQAQEEKKYQDYEDLADEIAVICGMKEQEKQRVLRWKLMRRYQISMKYGRKKQAFKALRQLRACKAYTVRQLLKDSLRIGLSESWIGKKLYRLYQKFQG